MIQHRVEIIILTYNRPDLLLAAVDSALSQDFKSFIVRVSDNSTDDRTEKLLAPYKSRQDFQYVRRQPTLPPLDHFNANISEAEGDYFILFHDDDILLPSALSRLVAILDKNPNAVAAAGNALYIKDGKFTDSKMMLTSNIQTVINSPEQLASIYMRGEEHPAFPGYLYRTNIVKNTKLLFKEGRKYSDVSFLIKVSRLGPIYWLSECLMYYRLHTGNDSGHTDIRAAVSLSRFINQVAPVEIGLVKAFKMRNYFVWLKRGNLKYLYKNRLVLIVVISCLKYFILNPKIVIQRVIRKIRERL